VAHVRLYVNGAYWGSYVHVESHSRSFLKRWFASNDGMMYEGGLGSDLTSASIPGGEEATETYLQLDFKPGPCSSSDPDRDPLNYEPALDLVGRLDALTDETFYPAVTEFVDFDRFLTMWAVDVAISNSDSYTYGLNNYRVYHDPSTRKWTVLPSGIDQTFELGETGEVDETFAADPWDVQSRLAGSCARNAACRSAARARMLEVMDHFEQAGLETEATAIHDLIRAHIQEDPRREFTLEEFETAYDALREYIRARPTEVRGLLSGSP
jgi:spore coat protein CotH